MKFLYILCCCFHVFYSSEIEGDYLEEVDVHDIEHLMLFIIYGIICAMILLFVKLKTNIPYTPMLLTYGLVIGVISDYLWAFGDAM
jgi:hypothetical protein